MPAATILLRPMSFVDISSVLLIEETLCDFPWSYGIFRDCIQAGYQCWVSVEEPAKLSLAEAEDCAGEILGYGLLSLAAQEGHILNLCIKIERQNQGLGTVMIKHLIVQAQKSGAQSVFLEVRLSNERAFLLYQRLGFIVIGYRKDYYEQANGKEDAIVMELRLSPAPALSQPS